DKTQGKAQAAGSEGGSTITSKIRSLLVGASVVVIVLGTFKMAMNLLDGGSPPPAPQAMENTSQPAPQAPPPVESRPAAPEQVTPSMTSPTPIGKQSLNNAAPTPAANSGSTASVEIPPAPPAATPPAPAANSDVTGALSGMSRARLGVVQIPPSEKLPDGIAGPALRVAAMKGDATAAYEIGVRYAEG